MARVVVGLPETYVGYFNKSGPVFNGQIYVGIVDLDPEIPGNQIDVIIEQEDGTQTTIPAGSQDGNLLLSRLDVFKELI